MNFSKYYNKLKKRKFTTIRKYLKPAYKIGKLIEITIKREFQFYALINDIKKDILLEDLDTETLLEDTDCETRKQAYELFNKFKFNIDYKKYKAKQTEYVFKEEFLENHFELYDFSKAKFNLIYLEKQLFTLITNSNY